MLNISPGLSGGHPLADESLLTITAILVRTQAERESRDFILLCFNFFIPKTFFPGLRGGNRLAAALYARSRRFWFAYKPNGRVGITFWCVPTF